MPRPGYDMKRHIATTHITKGSHRRRRRLSLRGVAAMLGVLLVIAAAGISYAFFTSSGSGSASAQNATLKSVILAAAGTPGSPLLPGGSGDVVFSLTNPNGYAVDLVNVTLNGSITPDASHGTCGTTNGDPVVTLSVPPSDLPTSIAAGATTVIHLDGAAQMDLAATNDCQGASFIVPLTVTVQP
jgi:hypothetical protein